MKNEPKIIYLNTGEEDVDKGSDFNELAGVSWCEDKMGKYDLKYYNEQVVKDLRKQMGFMGMFTHNLSVVCQA